ncbi:MAG: rhomboid family intramembrane serine protease [Acidimicrobiia bacterium]|nr:rhomboid family intramembrane serine protease [Acidimicrobiia bacterium]
MLVETPASPIQQAVRLMVIFVASMWLIEVVDVLVFDQRLDQQGIIPRTLGGLDGILWAPFLHGGFGHLLANTLPLLILGGFVALGGWRRWAAVTAFVVVVGGLATWLFARPAAHIGVSGLIFGYAGYLLVAGFVERSLRGIAVAIVVGFFFGGMVLRGITPMASWVSWESHLFGLAAGVLAAFVIAGPEEEPLAAGAG